MRYMRYIRTPTGEIFNLDECEIFDTDVCDKANVFFNVENQKDLAKELFEQSGIVIGECIYIKE